MATLKIEVPDGMEPFHNDLVFFWTLMARKLHTNRHKGMGMPLSPGAMLRGAEHELAECHEALTKEGQFELGVENADAANMHFLCARATWDMTRQAYDNLPERKKK